MLWRVATSKHIKDGYSTIAENWDIKTFMKSLEVIDCLDALEKEATDNANRR